MENSRVLVVGGSGYIGRELISHLASANYEVHNLSRGGQIVPEARLIKGSPLKRGLMERLCSEFECIVYLAGVVRTFKKGRYEENVNGARIFCDSVSRTNTDKRVIYFSTQNVAIDKTGPYGDSKKEAENIVCEELPNAVILRPNYVYGIDKKNDFFRLAKTIKILRVCPILGANDTKFCPINKSDLAHIVVHKILGSYDDYVGKIIDVSGGSTVSKQTIISCLREVLPYRFLEVTVPISLLMLFKEFIPFDIDGFNCSRISEGGNLLLGQTDFFSDLREIARLTL